MKKSVFISTPIKYTSFSLNCKKKVSVFCFFGVFFYRISLFLYG